MTGAAAGGLTPHPSLRGRSLVSMRHHTPQEVLAVLDLADRLKAGPRPWPALLSGRVVALVFERASTRTRVAFESAIARLGGSSIALAGRDMQLGRGETIEDTARVLERMVDAIVLRTGDHANVEELDRHSVVPVVNALSYSYHPTQALADAMTLRERFGALDGLELAYVGDGNNVCVSLMVISALTGMRMSAACPDEHRPDPEVVGWAAAEAGARGGAVRVTDDPLAAARGTRALYTDTWVSMGDEAGADARRRALTPYRIDEALVDAAASDAVVLHCLPAHHGEEISRELLHGPRSAAWDQSENKMHAAAALLVHVLGGRAGAA